MKDEDFPGAPRAVHAEVLRSDTPLQLAKLAAGEHQRTQHDIRECSTEDVVALLARECEIKLEQTGQAQLTDGEIFLQLETLGVVKETKLPKATRPAKKSTSELLVCYV